MNSKEDKYLIKTNRLSLEVIKQNDIGLVFRALSDDTVTRFYGVHFSSLEAARVQMDWYDELISEKKGIWWKLQLQETGETIGACGFNDWDHKTESAEVGFWMLPEWWGKGYMKEALKSILHYGFTSMELSNIYAEVEEGNAASVGVLEQFGFNEKHEKAFIENKNGIQTNISVYHLDQSSFLGL